MLISRRGLIPQQILEVNSFYLQNLIIHISSITPLLQEGEMGLLFILDVSYILMEFLIESLKFLSIEYLLLIPIMRSDIMRLVVLM
jgi:hypothetical protein